MSLFQNSVRRKIASAALGICMAALAGALPVSAAAPTTQTATGTGSVTATVPVNGTVQATTISVTVPINAAYAINPDANTFTAPALVVTNNSVVPINVGVQSLTADTTGSITDKLPSDENWASLNAADSAKYLALGVNITDGSGWDTGYSTSTDWAASKTPVQFGTLAAGSTGSMNLTGQFGRAISKTLNPTGSVVFSFSLA